MQKLLKSFGNAWNGIFHGLKHETNFRLQFICAGTTIIAAFIFQITKMEWLCILFCIGLVLSLELMNTAIEHFCNLVQKEYHPSIKIIKDLSAGAVFISALISLFCGAIIFIPRIISFIHSIN